MASKKIVAALTFFAATAIPIIDWTANKATYIKKIPNIYHAHIGKIDSSILREIEPKQLIKLAENMDSEIAGSDQSKDLLRAKNGIFAYRKALAIASSEAPLSPKDTANALASKAILTEQLVLQATNVGAYDAALNMATNNIDVANSLGKLFYDQAASCKLQNCQIQFWALSFTALDNYQGEDKIPDSVELEYRKGLAKHNLSEVEEAHSHYSKASSLLGKLVSDDNSLAYFYSGRAFFGLYELNDNKKNLEQAVSAYNTAINSNAQNVKAIGIDEFFLHRGNAYAELHGQTCKRSYFDKARSDYETAVQQNPNSAAMNQNSTPELKEGMIRFDEFLTQGAVDIDKSVCDTSENLNS